MFFLTNFRPTDYVALRVYGVGWSGVGWSGVAWVELITLGCDRLSSICVFRHARDATLFTCSWNFQHVRDATLFTCSWNFQHVRDATLFTCSWNFQHVRDATSLALGTSSTFVMLRS